MKLLFALLLCLPCTLALAEKTKPAPEPPPLATVVEEIDYLRADTAQANLRAAQAEVEKLRVLLNSASEMAEKAQATREAEVKKLRAKYKIVDGDRVGDDRKIVRAPTVPDPPKTAKK